MAGHKKQYRGLKGRKRLFKELGWDWNDNTIFTESELNIINKKGWF